MRLVTETTSGQLTLSAWDLMPIPLAIPDYFWQILLSLNWWGLNASSHGGNDAKGRHQMLQWRSWASLDIRFIYHDSYAWVIGLKGLRRELTMWIIVFPSTFLNRRPTRVSLVYKAHIQWRSRASLWHLMTPLGVITSMWWRLKASSIQNQ